MMNLHTPLLRHFLRHPLHITWLVCLGLALTLTSPAWAGGSLHDFLSSSQEDSILPPDEAFKLDVHALDAQHLQADFKVAEHHYLYKARITFLLDKQTLATELPQGEPKKDPNLGETEVYHHSVSALVTLPAQLGPQITIQASYQGCSEAGLCYAPIRKTLNIALPAARAAANAPAEASHQAAEQSPAQPTPPIAQNANTENETDQAAALLKSGHLGLIMAGFFAFGVLLSLTPCVLPMIPILSSIIVGGKQNDTRLHHFNLALAYTLGMALSYTLAGVAAAYSGQLISNLLQNAWALGFGALVFIALALSMFGFYELQLPDALESRMLTLTNRIKGGRFAGVFLMGALSALIVSPCVAAPLAGALLYISQTHDVWLGASALFALSMGMGVPLLLIGASAGKLLPKTGPWMNGVRQFFGVVMLGMAIWLVNPLLPTAVSMVLWGALLIIPAIMMHAVDPLPTHAHPIARFWKGVAILMLVYGVCIVVGAGVGSTSPLKPLAGFQTSSATSQATGLHFTRVRSVEAFEQALQAARGKPVMLDFYADWCVACKEMEQDTFRDAAVQRALANTVLLQADVTENSEQDSALLKRFGLFGPPGILFFNANGQEQSSLKVVGYLDPAAFLARLNQR